MYPHRTFPQELVDKIIDELGGAYLDHDSFKRSDYRINAGKALHACALVSRRWTGRSRAHLFKEVKVRPHGDDLLPIPPQFLLPYVQRLTLSLPSEPPQLIHTTALSKAFLTSSIKCLGITRGHLNDAPARLLECIVAFSAALQTIRLKLCELSFHNILDLVSTYPQLKLLHFRGCHVKAIPPDFPLVIDQGKAPGLELVVFGESPTDVDLESTKGVLAQLPNRFTRLHLEHFEYQSAIHTTNALIKANSKVLSSLHVHFILGTSRTLKQKEAANCFSTIH